MTEEELFARREQLTEALGVYIAKQEQLAPVAARIYAMLILNCRQGMTFDQLVENLGASKSTVWTHLCMLEANERIDYFTKPGDRKRYYKLISNRLMQFIDEKIERCKTEIKMQDEIIAYKKEANKVWKNDPEKQCDFNFNENMKTFLEESISSFHRLKDNLTNNQENPNND